MATGLGFDDKNSSPLEYHLILIKSVGNHTIIPIKKIKN